MTTGLLLALLFRCNIPSALSSARCANSPPAADPVQDLYLRELKAYKPTPLKAGDADEHVQKFAAPAAPKSPEEANLASELSAYESQEVEVEGQAAAGEAAPVEESWFEEDEEAPAAAH